MNSLTGNPSQKPAPSSTFSSYQFDFGLTPNRGSSSSRPLKDQKHPSNPVTAPNPSPSPPFSQPNKSSWTHQPAPTSAPLSSNLNGPASMVGDIFGKSWSSAAAPPSGVGIPKANPNLFGDLVGSALGQAKSNTNVPLKAAPPRNSYSMGSLSDSLPKSTGPPSNSGNSNPTKVNSWGSVDNLGNISSLNQSGPRFGGQPVKSSSGASANPKTDPFGSLFDLGSKKSGNPPISSTNASKPGVDSTFGNFQNAKGPDFGIPAQNPVKGAADFGFGDFQSTKIDDSGIPAQSQTQERPSNGADPLDVLFPSAAKSSGTTGSQQFGEMNDWDVGEDFGGGHDDASGTTELEGLPPPPAGVTGSMAKNKGLDNYKQGQFADAIKWLTWAVVLTEKSGDSSAAAEVLTCRASCYKEVGEYKKAVADCSKVLEHDSENVQVLLQRALLYESTEKYKLGAEDLRMVLKIDPGNRLAKSTIHRLNKLAG